MYIAGYEEPPKNHSLFVAKKGGNVSSKTDARNHGQKLRTTQRRMLGDTWQYGRHTL